MAKRYDIQAHRASRGDAGRGREATQPSDIPKRGWKDILLRTKQEQSRDYISLVAAGVAFYALLAIFPALAAAISIYGLVADPADIARHMESVMSVMPAEGAQILEGQLQNLASHPAEGLSIGVAIGILLALWSAAKGMKALMQGLNIAYEEDEKRGFIKLNAVALALTAAGIVFGIVTLSLIAGLPAALNVLNISGVVATVATVLSWVVLLGVIMAGLAVIYRYGPSRDEPQWRWVSWGAGVGTTLWLVGSILFSVYVANFGSYGKTYGSFGAVVILMMWFWLSAYAVLIGAELNSEMEHQTRADTTAGRPQPMGHRDATVADTLGKRQG